MQDRGGRREVVAARRQRVHGAEEMEVDPSGRADEGPRHDVGASGERLDPRGSAQGEWRTLIRKVRGISYKNNKKMLEVSQTHKISKQKRLEV